MAEKTLRYNVAIDNAQALKEIDELWDYAQQGSVAASRALNLTLGGTVKTVLDWEVRVDETGVKKLQPVVKEVLTEYDKLNNAAKKTNKTQEGSVTQLRQQLNTAKQVRDGITKIATETNRVAGITKGQLTPAWQAANAQVRDLNIKLAQAEGSLIQIAKAKFEGLGGLLSVGNALTEVVFAGKAFADIFQAINASIQPLIQREKQIQGLKLALSAFVSEQKNVEAVLSSAKGIALQYGGSLTQIERAYKRIAPAILASGGDLQDVEAVIESLTAKTTQLGLNTEQAGRYIEAFAQVMGKGKLQSEELNQQFSELDGALRSQIALYLETRYGITDLNEAMKNGEVTAGLFREAFIDAASSAREQLGGALKEVQARIDKLNIQQIENIRSTLNTISLESLNETFSGFGMSIQAIQTAFAQFFTALTTNLPNLKKGFTETFNAIGKILEVVVIGFINGLQLLLKLIDTVIGAFYALRDAVLAIPGMGAVVEGILAVGQALEGSFRQGTDTILDLGESVDITKGKFSSFEASLLQLEQDFANGKITQEEYKKSLESLYQKATDNSKQLLNAYQTEQEAVKALKKEINDRFDQESERIQSQIDEKKEALNVEKDGLKETLSAMKSVYDERKALIDEEIQKVKDRYDAELTQINAKTPAQQEQLRLRKQELQETARNVNAKYEERVAAQASLDTMRQQEQSALIRQKREEELRVLNQRAAEEKKQYEADRKAAEEASLARQKNIETAINELTKALKSNEEEQADYNKQLDESVRLNDELAETLDDIPGLIEQQVEASNRARNAYWEQAEAAKAIADQIERANRARANAPAGGPNRFAGGPVSGGATYTVNELGKEGFLSSSGKLSAINAPAWGQWRAPGAGTVVPADIFATIQATSSPSSASRAFSSVANARSGNGDLLRALMGVGSGDSIQNNVTIQAANTTQAASDILVSLTKIKRRRYGA